MTEMQVNVGMSDRATTLRLQGELDGAAGAVVSGCVEAVDPACGAVVVDLTGVSFIDSGGIWTLVELRRNLALDFRRLEVVGAHGQVRRILEMSGAGAFLEVA